MHSDNSGCKIAVLICCVDPRIQSNVVEAVDWEFGVRCFKLTAPGASRRLLDHAAREVMLKDVEFALGNGASMIVICHHGGGCVAYGENQGQQVPDMISSAGMLRDRFSVPVVFCMQDNPELAVLRTIGSFPA